MPKWKLFILSVISSLVEKGLNGPDPVYVDDDTLRVKGYRLTLNE